MRRVRRRPYFQPLDVLGLVHRAAAVGERAKTNFPESQPLDLEIAQFIQQRFADGSVHHLCHMLGILKNIRGIERIQARHDARQKRRARRTDIDRAAVGW